MDKEEAERLARAIERTRVDWIQVRGIEYNPMTGTYELDCVYRHDQALTQWTEMWIRNPRDWIDLLTRHGDDWGELELP